MTEQAPRGIVLLAHGSRDPLWRTPIEAVAARMQSLAPEVPVRCAYLELATPDLDAATAALVAQGVRQLRVVPLFLGLGKHTRQDLPARMALLRAQHPQLQIDLAPAVGEHAALTDLLARIALDEPDLRGHP